MHDCQKFREDWVADSAADYGDCEECRDFCQEAQLILQATDGAAHPVPEISEYYWNRFETRLRERLIQENALRSWHAYWKWPAMAAAAVLAVLAWSGAESIAPAVKPATETYEVEMTDAHIKGLDPMVVTFLEQSELFLRSFTKLDASYKEDLADAQSQARQGLDALPEQRELAGDFAPVQIALDEYEDVLRDIKNLEASEDLEDVQSRIQRRGLIANLKAYQPQLVLVSH